MKNAGKARSYGLYRHLRTSKEIIENLLNYLFKRKRPLILETVLCQKNNTLYSKYTAAPVTLRAN